MSFEDNKSTKTKSINKSKNIQRDEIHSQNNFFYKFKEFKQLLKDIRKYESPR